MNVALTPNLWPDDSELAWIAQFAAVLAAELARQDAEQARSALLLDLEKRVEARTRDLLASEQRFEELFRSTPQGLLIVDEANQVIQSNRSAQDMFGFGEAEFPGVSVTSLVPHEHRPRHDGHIARYRAAPDVRPMLPGARGEPRVVSAVRRDGSRFLADIRLVPVTVGDSHQVLVALADVTKQVNNVEAIARSLAEKETLLKEIHHRVKNNLQIISSLLMLQSDRMPSDDARAMLQESVYRVRSMALIHEQLYGVDSLARIDLGPYVRSLGDSLRSALAPHAVMQVNAESVEVAVDVAVPLGLILNELLTNAFKYGNAPPGATRPAGADVSVGIASDAETISVVVADSGPGLPPGFDVTRATSLGLHLVRSLARQLRARLTTHVGPGARFALVIPRNPAT
jgi:PAS domain S-box-containing protein